MSDVNVMAMVESGQKSAANPDVQEYTVDLIEGIRRNAEFKKKGLADFSANVGVRCSHGCKYCFGKCLPPSNKRCKELGIEPTEMSLAIVDPDSVARITRDAKRFKGRRGIIQFCATVDGWAPESKKRDLGRKCLEGILAEPDWVVRILTKNAAVAEDFDVCERYRDRVLVGISLTGTVGKQDMIKTIEPYASLISERMEAMREAHRRGLKTYGMLCPLLPGVSDSYADVLKLVEFTKEVGCEEVFCEAVNARSDAFEATRAALEQAGYTAEASRIQQIASDDAQWSQYAADLGENVHKAMTQVYGDASKLRYLLYGEKVTAADRAQLQALGDSVKWL